MEPAIHFPKQDSEPAFASQCGTPHESEAVPVMVPVMGDMP